MTRPRSLKVYRERLTAVRSEAAAAIAAAARESPEAGAVAAYAAMDGAFAALARRETAPGIACRAGCSACCHVNVEVTAPELRAIAMHVTSTFDRVEQQALVGRLREAVAASRALSDEARWAARLPCALLDGAGRCAAYAVRPLRCRAFHSTNAEACRAAFDGDPSSEPAVDAVLARVLDAVESGYDDALGAASHPGTRLEGALLRLLDGGASGGELATGVIATGATP